MDICFKLEIMKTELKLCWHLNTVDQLIDSWFYWMCISTYLNCTSSARRQVLLSKHIANESFLKVFQNYLRNKTSVPVVYYRVKSRVQMFYFESKSCVPLLKISSQGSGCWQNDVWLTVSWDPNKISSRRLLN